ncbi:Doublesex- and mab-3-related transcription factor A2 [Eumeta japonica]|uniref:Doublesex-and mab-3-related transcription factor A2 n=1 Tax=Eumeta variegata TaxID=151549 RepID=A0A4C1ZPS9_EUMVA|nr:Doublesex- and mab-3-related transcription factor A2 [Eumeta japonica]
MIELRRSFDTASPSPPAHGCPSPPAETPVPSDKTPPNSTPPLQTLSSSRGHSPSDNELNVEEELEEHSESSGLTPENLSLKESRNADEISVKKEEEDKWQEHQEYTKYKMYNRRDPRRNSEIRHLNDLPNMQRSEEVPPSEDIAPPQYPGHKSPVDVLIKVFPRRGRQEIETILARCKGDVVAAMEMMLNGSTEPSRSALNAHTPYNLNRESPPYSMPNYQSKSAFSPLSNQSFKFSPSRRFLTPPYSGTGYLPTVIRPPPEYLSSFLPPTELMYGRQQLISSPATSPTSDNTNNEGFSD